MPGALLWGWDATNKVWIPLQVDANGYVKVDLSNVNLDDLADVSVASPADDDLFYYDQASGLWKSRKLTDADIPAGIARDAEVAAAVVAEATARVADVDAEEDARIAADTAHAAKTTGTHGAGANTLWHGGLTDIIDKTHLSQDFGASSRRLLNFNPTCLSGYCLYVPHAKQSVFSGLINGAPTATSVVYDGDSNEDMFNGMQAYNGTTRWGQIILHNTTRGNSRKIVSVNLVTNTITTTSSTDDWADDDVITCQSQTNVTAGFFDLDLSAKIAATDAAIYALLLLRDYEGVGDANRFVTFHPYEAYEASKTSNNECTLANEHNNMLFFMPAYSQKITVMFGTGLNDCLVVSAVHGTMEYADT